MNIGRAVAIFINIESADFSDEEKGQAILQVVQMPTHNGIKKSFFLDVIWWLLRQAFDVPEGTAGPGGKMEANGPEELSIDPIRLVIIDESSPMPEEKAVESANGRRGPTGFEGKHPPADTRPKYTPPAGPAGRKKKHGRESGRKL